MTKHLGQDRGAVPRRHLNPPQQLAADSDIEHNKRLYHGRGTPQSPAYGGTFNLQPPSDESGRYKRLDVADCMLKIFRVEFKQNTETMNTIRWVLKNVRMRSIHKSYMKRSLCFFFFCDVKSSVPKEQISRLKKLPRKPETSSSVSFLT